MWVVLLFFGFTMVFDGCGRCILWVCNNCFVEWRAWHWPKRIFGALCLWINRLGVFARCWQIEDWKKDGPLQLTKNFRCGSQQTGPGAADVSGW